MIRLIFLFVLLLATVALSAQLRVPEAARVGAKGADAGAGIFDLSKDYSLDIHRSGAGRQTAPFNNLIPLSPPQHFEFGNTKPYLAFFCRLELDIEEATRFPVRFRLGEVRTWQQELSKRD